MYVDINAKVMYVDINVKLMYVDINVKRAANTQFSEKQNS